MKLSPKLLVLTAVILFSSTVLANPATVPQLSQITAPTPPSGSSSTASPTVSISNTDTGTSTGTETVPRITGTATQTSGGGLTGLPKLAGAYSYPPASVPPTQNAPYMQASSFPEGTVFIAVGSCLGFLAFIVLAWRGLVAWSLHRSVKRAALQQQILDNKSNFLSVAPMYKYSDRDSKISFGQRHKNGRPLTGTGAAASTQSLFFSPTGAAAAGAGGLSITGNRGSHYLPAGYYAAGASAPGGGAGMTHIGGDGSRENIILSNLRPQSQGYPHAQKISPNDSPAAYPQYHNRAGNMSTSTLDLNPLILPRTTASRAPSAYFDDLLDESSGAPGLSHERI